MLTNVTAAEAVKMANRVGREVARAYPGVEADDIASEALTRLYAKAGRLADAKAGYIYRVLERDASAYAAKVRYDRIVETSQYVYTPREVRALLEEVYFDPAAWDVPTEKDDWLSAELSQGTIGVSLMDLKEAMCRIKSEYQVILERRFYHGEAVDDTKAVTRAVDALTRAVNRIAAKTGEADEGPGSREVLSNSRALYRTAQDESGRHETDALAKLQKLKKQERSDPPGTHFNWNRHNN